MRKCYNGITVSGLRSIMAYHLVSYMHSNAMLAKNKMFLYFIISSTKSNLTLHILSIYSESDLPASKWTLHVFQTYLCIFISGARNTCFSRQFLWKFACKNIAFVLCISQFCKVIKCQGFVAEYSSMLLLNAQLLNSGVSSSVWNSKSDVNDVFTNDNYCGFLNDIKYLVQYLPRKDFNCLPSNDWQT